MAQDAPRIQFPKACYAKCLMECMSLSVIAVTRAFLLQLLPTIMVLVMARNKQMRHYRNVMLPLYPVVSDRLILNVVRIPNLNLESLQQ